MAWAVSPERKKERKYQCRYRKDFKKVYFEDELHQMSSAGGVFEGQSARQHLIHQHAKRPPEKKIPPQMHNVEFTLPSRASFVPISGSVMSRFSHNLKQEAVNTIIQRKKNGAIKRASGAMYSSVPTNEYVLLASSSVASSSSATKPRQEYKQNK